MLDPAEQFPQYSLGGLLVTERTFSHTGYVVTRVTPAFLWAMISSGALPALFVVERQGFLQARPHVRVHDRPDIRIGDHGGVSWNVA